MTYLALGDSISIDDYTEVEGGGAASQLARLLGADPFVDLTRDGRTTDGLLADLARDDLPRADCATVTIGGNDLLGGYFERAVGDRATSGTESSTRLRTNLVSLGERLAALGCPVVMNTIYDPTDGDDARAAELGLSPLARFGLQSANRAIQYVATLHGFLLCDLEALFSGHGYWSDDPWIVMHIEPNLTGATAIAGAWHALLR